MAAITKRRARFTLAGGPIQLGWSNMPVLAGHPETGEKYTIGIPGKDGAYFTTHLSPQEVLALMVFVGKTMTYAGANSLVDKRSPSDVLRALADKLEGSS